MHMKNNYLHLDFRNFPLKLEIIKGKCQCGKYFDLNLTYASKFPL